MRSTIWKLMTLAIIIFVVIGGTVGCSDSNAECKVTYDAKEDIFEIIVNPPGEPGEFTQYSLDEGMKRKTSMSKEPGKDLVKITQYEINLERTYKGSGNTYGIVGYVKFDDSGKKSKLIGYNLTITGGVYGETPHTCTK